MTPLDDISAVSRFTAADRATVLERLAGSDLIERGAVNLISVEAIRDRSHDRWPRRREDVWAYVERKLHEHLTAQDLRQRVSETDFLIALTAEQGVAAQAVSLRILEEVLMHFLGESRPADLKILAVHGLDGDQLVAAPLDPGAISAARQENAAAAARRNGVDPKLARRRNPVVLTSASGHSMQIDFALETVVSLKHGVTAALRVHPTVTFTATGQVIPAQAFTRLPDADIAAIDQATIALAALYVPTMPVASRAALIVPTSFRTLAGRKGRGLLASAGGLEPERIKGGVMVELVDVDRGTPPGRLIEVVGLVGSMTRGVLARLHPARDMLAAVRECRFQGMTFDVGDAPGDAAQFAAALRGVVAQARGASPSLIAVGLANDTMIDAARKAGFTHAARREATARAAARPAA